jgi:predicted GNAT family acetyltransferase
LRARGDLPFLHAWKSNTAADTIYESLGFVRRADVNVAELGKRSTMENAAANIGF